MDSNQKPLPSPPPPPPPPPPPKNGNTRGCPPLISTNLHDEGDGGVVGLGDMEVAALRRGSPRASRHELSGSGRHELSGSSRHELSGSGRRLEGKASSYVETKMPPRSLVGCPSRDEATTEQRGLPPQHPRVVARLRLASHGTVAAVDDRPYACADCSMTFGRETALCGHMRSHKRDHLSSDSEEDASTPKRRRKKRKSKLRTVKPLEATWGNHARRNGIPRDTPAEVKFSGSESNVTIRNIAVAMHDSNEVTENKGSGDDNSVIVIDDDDDDANPVIAVAGSHGAPGPAPDASAALAMAPAPAVAVATPMPALHAAAASVNTKEAPAIASTAAVTIPPAPASAAVATITRAPLATAVSVATQTAPDLVKGNNGSGQVGARYRYGGNGKAVARNSNACGKSLAGYGNVNYGKGVAGYSDAGYGGKGLAGCSSGSHTHNTSIAAGGESNKGRGKVYSCPECKNTFFSTPQALGGHITSRHRIMEKKGKAKQDLQSGPHKCKVCNHVCQTGPELSFHMMGVHPHPAVVAAASANKEKTFEATGINNIGAAVDGPYNTMGWRFPSGASRSSILALLASMAPVHQPPQGTMAMAGNPVTGHSLAANTSTGWSLPGTTSSILPAIPLHNQEQNLLEQIAAVALGNHGHHNINPALFSFSRRQEIAVVPSNAIASSSSTPRPGVAVATEPSQAIGINNYFAAIDAPANTMGRRLPFFLAGRSDTQALPVSRPVHHPTQGMAIYGNPLTGHFPAAISATGWSFPATTNNVLPSIPLQNQEDGCRSFNPALFSKRQEKNPLEEIAVVLSNAITSSTSTPHPSVAAATEPSQAIAKVNSNAAAIDALANTMRHLPFFLTGRSAIHAPPVSMPVHQPTQGMASMAGNPVTGHFPAALAGNGCSFPASTSSVLPAIPLQTQEENLPQGTVVPANELADPSQNQAENPPEETVPGNNGGRTILVFGFNIAEGQKEVKEPKK